MCVFLCLIGHGAIGWTQEMSIYSLRASQEAGASSAEASMGLRLYTCVYMPNGSREGEKRALVH